MKRAAVYLRVSTDKQDEENQRAACERICTARGWQPIAFCEVESGAKRRPEWARVMEYARQGEFVAVVVWSIDRVGRVRTEIAHDLAELLRFGVVCVAHQQPWLDTAPTGPLRDFLIQVFGWVAEGERIELIARTKAGLERARAQGKRLGRPAVAPELVRKVLHQRRQLSLLNPGRPPTLAEIARAVGAPWSTVKDIITRNPPPNETAKPQEGRAEG